MFKLGGKSCRKTERVFFVSTYAAALAGPIRPDRKAHAVGHRPVGALRQICEGEDGDRAELRQAAQVCVHAPVFPLNPAMPGAVNHKSHNPAFWRQESDQEVRQAREQGWTRLQVRGEHMFHVYDRMISDKSAFLKRCWCGGLTHDLGTPSTLLFTQMYRHTNKEKKTERFTS